MNRRLALLLGLIALTTGQAFGESDFKAQLSRIKDVSAILKGVWTSLSVGNNDEDVFIKVAELQGTVDSLTYQVGELPDNSGTFLYDIGIKNLLKDTGKLLADSYYQSLTALNKRKSDESQHDERTHQMLSNIRKMVEHISSAFQQKLAQWSNNMDSNKQRNLQVILVDYRRTLLKPLEMMATKMCEVKVDASFIIAYDILHALQTAAEQVKPASCNGLFSCISGLVTIADRIYEKAQC